MGFQKITHFILCLATEAAFQQRETLSWESINTQGCNESTSVSQKYLLLSARILGRSNTEEKRRFQSGGSQVDMLLSLM